MPDPNGPRVRAPELRARGWLNTGGRALTLADLRGKIVLLDFWTFCCINCLDWGVPVIVHPDGPTRLPLILRGLDA